MKDKMKLAALSALAITALFCLCACGGPDAAEAGAKYTDEIAKAVIESGWKVAGSIIIGAFIVALLS